MSAEESFIVLEETPSMLQFSLLDSLTLNSENVLENNASIESNINTNGSANNPDHINLLAEPSMKFDSKIKSTDNDLSFASLNAESIASVMTQNEEKSRSPPKTTLAQSFLLGDINCDKMKVIFMAAENHFQFNNHYFNLFS